jgi:hypothetical protein
VSADGYVAELILTLVYKVKLPHYQYFVFFLDICDCVGMYIQSSRWLTRLLSVAFVNDLLTLVYKVKLPHYLSCLRLFLRYPWLLALIGVTAEWSICHRGSYQDDLTLVYKVKLPDCVLFLRLFLRYPWQFALIGVTAKWSICHRGSRTIGIELFMSCFWGAMALGTCR